MATGGRYIPSASVFSACGNGNVVIINVNRPSTGVLLPDSAYHLPFHGVGTNATVAA
ncbi:uncharacterized protein BO96DRAFT_439253 [Aspergillus niger CBS 101883]|uniref:Uncharacterized protein n=2 Tax=Aspergillus niger TaxID=5061 RepID=A2RAT6_ASPNC|nr:uncharacterized protein BO96DRAFT_439253 [Aspergillus niger CBS 101883]XP_059602922.1 hypothetical protein An18g04295 [Aspergillus niger]PYH51142.1 hypothetical protein BO96DRAFT_439253 [Aspergillus niger CBS 101883]CAK43232.1 hypothetical protein An18g04295 [Aspergillus niger]